MTPDIIEDSFLRWVSNINFLLNTKITLISYNSIAREQVNIVCILAAQPPQNTENYAEIDQDFFDPYTGEALPQRKDTLSAYDQQNSQASAKLLDMLEDIYEICGCPNESEIEYAANASGASYAQIYKWCKLELSE